MYYYTDQNGVQQGPVEKEALRHVGLRPDTLVWKDGMSAWTRAADVPEVAVLLPSGVPPCPPRNFPASNRQAKPQNWLWLGICTTILCCLPFGIVSIVYASKVDSCWGTGDYQGAVSNSEKAKMWGMIAAGVGLVVSVLYFLILVAAA